MVTDKKIIVSNGRETLELTADPYTVKSTKGFDRLEIQLVTSQGYDQEGASLLNSYILPRAMEIEGQLRASNTYRMQELRDKLFSLFIPKADVTISHYYGGKKRMIVARVEKSPEFKATEVSTLLEYNVQLTAPEPYWKDTDDTVAQIATTAGAFRFPLSIPEDEGVIFGIKSASVIADLYNYSSIKVGMKIVFVANGEVKNPQLFNIKTREFIRLVCEMSAGEQIEIQTGQEKSVTKYTNGVEEDYIGKIDLAGGGNTFLELAPGDNLLRYGADGGEDLLETKIYYRNKYPGV